MKAIRFSVECFLYLQSAIIAQTKILEGRTKSASKLCPSQTKILEFLTNLCECVFEALFKGVSTRFGLRIQNLRLGEHKPRKGTLKLFTHLSLTNEEDEMRILFRRA